MLLIAIPLLIIFFIGVISTVNAVYRGRARVELAKHGMEMEDED
jgi:hypothetical protein